MHTCRWCNLGVIFGYLLLHKLHGDVSVFLSCSVVLSYSSSNTIHKLEDVMANIANVTHSNHTLFWDPQCPVLAWAERFHNIVHDSRFILCYEAWSAIAVFWILEPFVANFSQSGGSPKHYQCLISQCLHMYARWYCNLYFSILPVSDLVSITRCQRNQYSEYSLLYECQFQAFQNHLKYILSQLPMPNLLWWPTHCWF